MSTADDDTRAKRLRARERALRAARAVTLGAALAIAGCASSHTPDGDRADADIPRDGDVPADAGPDSPPVVVDAGRDGGSDFDGVCPPGVPWYEDADCCEMGGGGWYMGSCAVPGPFVPPSMDA